MITDKYMSEEETDEASWLNVNPSGVLKVVVIHVFVYIL